MIVFAFDIEDCDGEPYLYTRLDIAKACAEKSLKHILADYDDAPDEEDIEVQWRLDPLVNAPTPEEINSGIRHMPTPEDEAGDDERLYYQIEDGPWVATAYIVGPLEVFEEMNF